MSTNVLMIWFTVGMTIVLAIFAAVVAKKKIWIMVGILLILTGATGSICVNEFGLFESRPLPPAGYQILKKGSIYSFHNTNSFMSPRWGFDSWPNFRGAVAAAWREYDKEHPTDTGPKGVVVFPPQIETQKP